VKQVAGRAFRSSAFFRRAYIIYGDSLSAPSKGGAEPFLNRGNFGGLEKRPAAIEWGWALWN
jgi:hypothetical protein